VAGAGCSGGGVGGVVGAFLEWVVHAHES
jgi:hypothetical protein